LTPAYEITLRWPPRQLNPNARPHHMALNRARQEYKELAYLTTLSAVGRDRPLNWPTVRCRATFYCPDRRRRDRDNLAAMLKPAWDGIALAIGIDDGRFIHEPVRKELDRDDPRVEITIYREER